IWPAVVASMGANTWSWMAQPNSGRIGRSPGAVPRISRIASSISRTRSTMAMLPVASVRTGKAQPRPMNSSAIALPSDQHGRRRAAELARCAGVDGAGRAGLGGGAALDQHAGRALDHPADLGGREHERVAGMEPDVRRGVEAGGALQRGRLAA